MKELLVMAMILLTSWAVLDIIDDIVRLRKR